MDKRFETPSSPFTHCGASTQRIMLDVIIALLPATAAAIVIFGAPALVPILSCVIAAVVSEFLFNAITHRKQSVGDLSAVVTGLLLGLNLSTNVPVWQCVLGSVFAIVFVKCLFGGLGHNFANPAITARVFMLVSFTQVMGGAITPLHHYTADNQVVNCITDIGNGQGRIGSHILLLARKYLFYLP